MIFLFSVSWDVCFLVGIRGESQEILAQLDLQRFISWKSEDCPIAPRVDGVIPTFPKRDWDHDMHFYILQYNV